MKAIDLVPRSVWLWRARFLWSIGNRRAFRWALRHAMKASR